MWVSFQVDTVEPWTNSIGKNGPFFDYTEVYDWFERLQNSESPLLTLLLVGYPEPRLYWFKDGQPLQASDRILKTEKKQFHALEILNVIKEDAGQYSVFITNSAGSAYSSASLVVKGKLLVLSASGYLWFKYSLFLIKPIDSKIFWKIKWAINRG